MNKKKDLMKVNNKKSLTFSVPSVSSVVKILLFFSSSHQSPITNHQSPFPITFPLPAMTNLVRSMVVEKKRKEKDLSPQRSQSTQREYKRKK
jgi:hypothetical protein